MSEPSGWLPYWQSRSVAALATIGAIPECTINPVERPRYCRAGLHHRWGHDRLGGDENSARQHRCTGIERRLVGSATSPIAVAKAPREPWPTSYKGMKSSVTHWHGPLPTHDRPLSDHRRQREHQRMDGACRLGSGLPPLLLRLHPDETFARIANRGLWAGTFEMPWDFRHQSRR